MTDAAARAGKSGSYQLAVDNSRAPRPRPAPGARTLRDEDGQILAATWTRGPDRVIELPGLATFACSRGRSTVAAWTEPDVEQTAVAAAFQRSVIPLLLYFSGHEVLHASAVHSAKGVVGFCAEAGTGKSTLAYGLSTRGFALWADDALALDLSRPLRAVLLPCEPRLRPRSVRFFESSSFEQYSGADGETALVAGLAVIKRMAGADDIVQIERLSGGRAFDEVVRHAYRLDLKADRARRKTLIQNYMNIVDSVPVFEIRFRPRFRDFSFVLDAVTELLNAQLERAA